MHFRRKIQLGAYLGDKFNPIELPPCTVGSQDVHLNNHLRCHLYALILSGRPCFSLKLPLFSRSRKKGADCGGDEKEKRMEWQIVHKSNLLGIFQPSLSPSLSSISDRCFVKSSLTLYTLLIGRCCKCSILYRECQKGGSLVAWFPGTNSRNLKLTFLTLTVHTDLILLKIVMGHPVLWRWLSLRCLQIAQGRGYSPETEKCIRSQLLDGPTGFFTGNWGILYAVW